MNATRALAHLEKSRDRHDAASAGIKLEWLAQLQRADFQRASQVLRLHELLCWLRAYPEDAQVLRRVERILAGFARRKDLYRHRHALADSGIAGMAINYPFFWSTARWLVRRWPTQIHLNRDDQVARGKLRVALPKLLTAQEKSRLAKSGLDTFAAIDRLRGRMSDASWLIRRVTVMPGDDFNHETFYDDLEPWCVFAAASGTPSRTTAWHKIQPPVFQKTALRKTRPDLREQLHHAARKLQRVSPKAGEQLLELARGAMLMRHRDLDAFAYGDPRDVRVVHDANGLSFGISSLLPERQKTGPEIHGYLMLQNGVPLGYGELGISGRRTAISFNVFETFRGGETAWLFARMLAVVRQLFRVDSFTLDAYQLGKNNDEAIVSGAWWFYYKLGFRPRSAAAQRVLRAEQKRMRAKPDHRSSAMTLRKLAESPMVWRA